MSTLSVIPETQTSNPLDLVEHIITSNSWPFERSDENEINISIGGSWVDYHMSFTWRSELGVLQLTCAFDLKVPQPKRSEINNLLAMINEQLWLGHFDLWPDEGVLLYRHGHLLRGGSLATMEECETLVSVAIDSCERYYPAFQFVLWGGKSAKEAIAATMLECVGEA